MTQPDDISVAGTDLGPPMPPEIVGPYTAWLVHVVGVAVVLIAEVAARVERAPAGHHVEPNTTKLVTALVISSALGLTSLTYVARRFRAGRPWARWALVLLFGVGAALTLEFCWQWAGDPESELGLPPWPMPLVIVVLVVAGAVAAALSFQPEVNRYFRECRAFRAAVRPDPGTPPVTIRAASLAWLLAVVLISALAWWTSSGGSALVKLMAAVCLLAAVRGLWRGSLVARRWLTALAVWSMLVGLDAIPVVGVHPYFTFVALAAALVVASLVGLALTYLPASRAYTRAAQPPPPHKPW